MALNKICNFYGAGLPLFCTTSLFDLENHIDLIVGPVAQSVWRLATDWTVRGSNPDGSEIFRTPPDRPWGPSSLLYNGYRVLSRG
jgi:hypothetical protein